MNRRYAALVFAALLAGLPLAEAAAQADHARAMAADVALRRAQVRAAHVCLRRARTMEPARAAEARTLSLPTAPAVGTGGPVARRTCPHHR